MLFYGKRFLRERIAMDARKTLIRIVLVCLLLYAAVCLLQLGRELRAAQDAGQLLSARLQSVERENNALRQRLQDGRSTEEWESLAWQRLGLLKPGEIVFLFPQEDWRP